MGKRHGRENEAWFRAGCESGAALNMLNWKLRSLNRIYRDLDLFKN